MFKKILCLAFLTLSMIFLLTSCKHEHEFGSWVSVQEATCQSEGRDERKCECGETETRSTSKLQHLSGGWIIDIEPTCIESGSKHRECNLCKETTSTHTIPVSDHKLGDWINIKATCVEEGYKFKQCSVCNQSFEMTVTSSALGHREGEWIISIEPTCTQVGEKQQLCSKCNDVITTASIFAIPHTYEEWIIDTPAACTEDGTKHRNCSVCDNLEIETITKLGHTDGEWITDKEANCTEDGSKHQICSVCNETIKTGTITKLGHTDGEWITDKEANCTEDGSKHQICSICEVTINTEIIEKRPHTNGDWIIDTQATCTANGSKHQICSVCETTLKSETITKLGHSYGNWIIDQDSTCAETGSKHQICSRCSSYYTATISKKNHNYRGTTCVDCRQKRIVYNFYWEESFDETYAGCRKITIVVGEEYQIKYSADITENLFYDRSNFVFYEPYVVDEPSVISIDDNGKIKGLKTGIVGIKNTGAVISGSDNIDDRRLYIEVISEYVETEYNDTIGMADEIKPGQTIKFRLSDTSDIDVFKFTAPSSYVTIKFTYHGDYTGASSGQSRLMYVQILDANGNLMNSGTNSHDSGGDVYNRNAYVGTSTGYIIVKKGSDYSSLLPSGYFTIEITSRY